MFNLFYIPKKISHRITSDNSISLRFYPNGGSDRIVYSLYPVKSCLHLNVIVIYIYEKSFNRQSIYVTYLQFWKSKNTLFFKIMLVLGTIIIYLIRKRAKLQGGLLIGFSEIFMVFFGGGNVQSHHKWEKMFFTILMVAAFFWVSIYLSNFSIHSTISDDIQNVNTFQILAKQNVTYYLTESLNKEQSIITQMLL